MPGLRKRGPMRLSVPMPWHTCCTSAPTDSQIDATALTNEIFMARKALEACLISSALLALVMIKRRRKAHPVGAGMASLRGVVVTAVGQRRIDLRSTAAQRSVSAPPRSIGIEERSVTAVPSRSDLRVGSESKESGGRGAPKMILRTQSLV